MVGHGILLPRLPQSNRSSCSDATPPSMTPLGIRTERITRRVSTRQDRFDVVSLSTICNLALQRKNVISRVKLPPITSNESSGRQSMIDAPRLDIMPKSSTARFQLISDVKRTQPCDPFNDTIHKISSGCSHQALPMFASLPLPEESFCMCDAPPDVYRSILSITEDRNRAISLGNS